MKHLIEICLPGTVFMFLAMLLPYQSIAQGDGVIENGKIEFERTENAYYYLDNYYGGFSVDMKKYADDYKSNFPKFKNTTFVLDFDTRQSYYHPKSNTEIKFDFLSQFASVNSVEINFDQNRTISQKNILGISYLVVDSAKNIQWKITGETREIAGFLCRRANAVIADSIYVVAFYTDQILAKGGPELFVGLPGMILGVALPNEHITWFAKNYSPEVKKDVLGSVKRIGRPIDAKGLDDVIKSDVNTKSSILKNFVRRRAIF